MFACLIVFQRQVTFSFFFFVDKANISHTGYHPSQGAHPPGGIFSLPSETYRHVTHHVDVAVDKEYLVTDRPTDQLTKRATSQLTSQPTNQPTTRLIYPTERPAVDQTDGYLTD